MVVQVVAVVTQDVAQDATLPAMHLRTHRR